MPPASATGAKANAKTPTNTAAVTSFRDATLNRVIIFTLCGRGVRARRSTGATSIASGAGADVKGLVARLLSDIGSATAQTIAHAPRQPLRTRATAAEPLPTGQDRIHAAASYG